ncbi:hypothetical protein LJU02_00670 [Corynebacterium pseudotuberculosis]|uniref:Secreted protein n=1 Tax=Corynebacterium pseudotuberculosis 258 TaxID=1168865 RepID=A0AAU8RQ00_CORPS|nr:hypothetical protein [Corynebacterium pseudotuberculosis]AJF93826.2 hypothetical protein CP258_00680 [Corynebacterium pseudotuberculosis 258]AKN59560.1 hypothetical protein CP31_00675 [Corynebacterium pseudotuberculosis 31]AKS12480.1 Hypothetical protein CpE19_0137 [Corynebacterium pseudotuberculosis]AMN69238.1 hypothetical protein ATN02_01110 [Corynebacterium pseudotuberculosis]AMN71081.1 hypothetical protein ATN03_00675 [Corynebacterium pseudotuberculosis]
MKKKPLVAASLAFALAAVATPTAVSAATESQEQTISFLQSESAAHSDKFAKAMEAGKRAEETNDTGLAMPTALPALVGGIAVKEGAKWAGKQVAKGALTEAGKRLIGIF